MSFFFFSYAHGDWKVEQRLRMLYKDLGNLIATRRGLSAARSKLPEGEAKQAGFRDEDDIALGADWVNVLTDNLRTCQVFVFVRTPNYFMSDYCGREWQLFSSRLEEYNRQNKSDAKLILPILWVRPEDVDILPQVRARMPKDIDRLQYTHGDFPGGYRETGLLQLILEDGIQDGSRYKNFLVQFADKMLEAANKWPLPEAVAGSSIDQVQSAFQQARTAEHLQANGQDVANGSATPNRFRARFYFIAANTAELKQVKELANVGWVGRYGPGGGPEWCPYPPPNDDIEWIAQDVATAREVKYFLGDNTKPSKEQIDEARQRNEIVILVIDPWTTRLPVYRQVLQAFDSYDSYNYAVVVVWNHEGANAADVALVKREILQNIFPIKSFKGEKSYYLESVRSRDDLVKQLGLALETVRSEIVRYSNRFRAARSDKGTSGFTSLSDTTISGAAPP